jgi:hypothetical protein
MMSFEGTVRGTLILWIPSPNSRVTCCLDLEQQVYVWVECHPSKEYVYTNAL